MFGGSLCPVTTTLDEQPSTLFLDLAPSIQLGYTVALQTSYTIVQELRSQIGCADVTIHVEGPHTHVTCLPGKPFSSARALHEWVRHIQNFPNDMVQVCVVRSHDLYNHSTRAVLYFGDNALTDTQVLSLASDMDLPNIEHTSTGRLLSFRHSPDHCLRISHDLLSGEHTPEPAPDEQIKNQPTLSFNMSLLQSTGQDRDSFGAHFADSIRFSQFGRQAGDSSGALSADPHNVTSVLAISGTAPERQIQQRSTSSNGQLSVLIIESDETPAEQSPDNSGLSDQPFRRSFPSHSETSIGRLLSFACPSKALVFYRTFRLAHSVSFASPRCYDGPKPTKSMGRKARKRIIAARKQFKKPTPLNNTSSYIPPSRSDVAALVAILTASHNTPKK